MYSYIFYIHLFTAIGLLPGGSGSGIQDSSDCGAYIFIMCKHLLFSLYVMYDNNRPPLWSSGQSFWLQIQRSRVRSPARPDFLSSGGSGTGSTQPREPREVN